MTIGAIGVFDSGMGGLTVLAALRRALPLESFVYLGDTARLPYGVKSRETVSRYALQAARTLLRHEIKLLVVACNTVSAVALPALEHALAPIPVLGVIAPGARAALAVTRNRRIAVIATEGTVAGGAYLRAISEQDAEAIVVQRACPLMVSLAEEDWVTGPVPLAVARHYLDPLFAENPEPPDTLVLGCTHFPRLREVIQQAVGAKVRIVDSAQTTARQVHAALGASDHARTAARLRFLVTDSPDRFARIGARFLGEPIARDGVELVDLPLD